MRFLLPLATFGAAIGLAVAATPATAQPPLETGFVDALEACEAWVLHPESWADEGLGHFLHEVDLGDRMRLVESVDDAALPPVEWRRVNHYWRIDATPQAGYLLVVSARVPMCQITGDADADLQPVVASVVAWEGFAGRWELVKADAAASVFRNRRDPAFSLTINRPPAPGRQGRLQVLASAIYTPPERN